MMKKVLLAASIVFGLGMGNAFAQFKYVEGSDYQPIPVTIDHVSAPKVIEFFWYGCPHCYDMYQPMHNWISKTKPEAIQIEEVPAMPSPQWEIGGHLYYTAKALNLDLDRQIFDEVHKKNNVGIILNPENAKAYLVSQGIPKDKVEKAWDSFAVKQNIERAKKMFSDAELTGVPTFIVNGAYQVPFNGKYDDFFIKLNTLAQSPQMN